MKGLLEYDDYITCGSAGSSRTSSRIIPPGGRGERDRAMVRNLRDRNMARGTSKSGQNICPVSQCFCHRHSKEEEEDLSDNCGISFIRDF